MKTCPWCGYENLNVYVYCQRCGRGFEEPDNGWEPPKAQERRSMWRRLWPWHNKAA
jgi:hypothetical protein